MLNGIRPREENAANKSSDPKITPIFIAEKFRGFRTWGAGAGEEGGREPKVIVA